MWWRLVVLAVATAAVLFTLLTPIPISVKLTLPPSNAGPPTSEVVTPPAWVNPVGQGVIIVLVLVGAGLIAKRIIRGHGKDA